MDRVHRLSCCEQESLMLLYVLSEGADFLNVGVKLSYSLK